MGMLCLLCADADAATLCLRAGALPLVLSTLRAHAKDSSVVEPSLAALGCLMQARLLAWRGCSQPLPLHLTPCALSGLLCKRHCPLRLVGRCVAFPRRSGTYGPRVSLFLLPCVRVVYMDCSRAARPCSLRNLAPLHVEQADGGRNAAAQGNLATTIMDLLEKHKDEPAVLARSHSPASRAPRASALRIVSMCSTRSSDTSRLLSSPPRPSLQHGAFDALLGLLGAAPQIYDEEDDNSSRTDGAPTPGSRRSFRRHATPPLLHCHLRHLGVLPILSAAAAPARKPLLRRCCSQRVSPCFAAAAPSSQAPASPLLLPARKPLLRRCCSQHASPCFAAAAPRPRRPPKP